MPAKNLAQIAALPLDILRAAHLVDRVFLDAPVRQWVLRLPYTLRYRMAYDSKLVSAIHQIFMQAVFASLRRRARAGKTIAGKKLKCGAMNFIQRSGDALNLNVHFHKIAFGEKTQLICKWLKQ
jgi:hypothetical protein